MFGIQKTRDPYFDQLQNSVMGELSKYADPVDVKRDNKNLLVISPEEALEELKKIYKNSNLRKHF